jgi:RNA polymerase sigma factor (sigma-70 family)
MEKDLIGILNNHRGLIFKVCNFYCRDEEDRKDLFQEIVLQTWKALPSFRGDAALSTWMYRIALNTAITHLKKERRLQIRNVEFSDWEVPDLGSPDEELHQELYRAIDGLDKLEKSVILLYLENKSYEEIAEILGMSKSNVGVRINRIKSKLSMTLKK